MAIGLISVLITETPTQRNGGFDILQLIFAPAILSPQMIASGRGSRVIPCLVGTHVLRGTPTVFQDVKKTTRERYRLCRHRSYTLYTRSIESRMSNSMNEGSFPTPRRDSASTASLKMRDEVPSSKNRLNTQQCREHYCCSESTPTKFGIDASQSTAKDGEKEAERYRREKSAHESSQAVE